MAKLNAEAIRTYLEANDVTIPAKAKNSAALKKLVLEFWDENEIEPEYKCDSCGGTFPDDDNLFACPWCGSEFEEVDGDEEPPEGGDSSDDVSNDDVDGDDVISKPKAKGKTMSEKKKATPKATPKKKAAAEKATPKKKAPAKKVAAEKATPKKKAATEKATPKKKAAAEKATPKKKAATEKAAPKKKEPAKKKSSPRASGGAWSTGVSVSAQLKEFDGSVIQDDGKLTFTSFRLGIESIAAKLESENPDVVESMKRLRRRAQYAVMPAAHQKPFGQKELPKLVAKWADAHNETDDRNTKFANSAMACLAGGSARMSSVLEEPNYEALWEAGAMIERAIKSTKSTVVEKLAVKIMAVFGWELLE